MVLLTLVLLVHIFFAYPCDDVIAVYQSLFIKATEYAKNWINVGAFNFYFYSCKIIYDSAYVLLYLSKATRQQHRDNIVGSEKQRLRFAVLA